MIKGRNSKYNAKKHEYDGIVFDSLMELKFYKELKNSLLDFSMQQTFELQPKFTYKGQTILPIKYKCDFIVEDTWVIDIKGMKTPDFKLKEKMFKYKYGDKYNFICLTVCPKKYQAEVLKDESAWWGQLGFIENSLLEKLRKTSKKNGGIKCQTLENG